MITHSPNGSFVRATALINKLSKLQYLSLNHIMYLSRFVCDKGQNMLE